MNTLTLLACAVLLIGTLAYVFVPARNPERQRVKTRMDFLRERKDQVFDNLRDLNFEYRAGKYPDEDYNAQRATLEVEAAAILSEMDQLEAGNATAAKIAR